MKGEGFEAWLWKRWRDAPSPEPSSRLWLAVASDRRDHDQARARGHRMANLAWGLPGRRVRLAGLVGLALVVVVAATGLVIVTGRLPAQNGAKASTLVPSAVSSPSVRTSIAGISWHASATVPLTAQEPHVTSAGGRLFMVGTNWGEGTKTEVFSSADAVNWQPVSFDAAIGSGFSAAAISDDGSGGLLVVGQDVVNGGYTVSPTIWHSSDGLTFARAQVEDSPGAMIDAAASRAGEMVAVGWHRDPNGISTMVDLWFSTDAVSWKHQVLPGASGCMGPDITIWKGEFMVVCDDAEKTAVWASVNGRDWQKSGVNLGEFVPKEVLPVGDRVVLLGYLPDMNVGPIPVSRSSLDGLTWAEAHTGAVEPPFRFNAAAIVDGEIVAVMGSGQVDNTTDRPRISISIDGIGWTDMPTDDALPAGYFNASVTAFDGRAVLAISNYDATGAVMAGVRVFVGDLR